MHDFISILCSSFKNLTSKIFNNFCAVQCNDARSHIVWISLYTHTHTHTHIYIYIYIYTLIVGRRSSDIYIAILQMEADGAILEITARPFFYYWCLLTDIHPASPPPTPKHHPRTHLYTHIHSQYASETKNKSDSYTISIKLGSLNVDLQKSCPVLVIIFILQHLSKFNI